MINSVTAAMYDAVLNFREAYVEYIPNYPIAAYRIDDEMANNPQFKAFVEVSGFSFIFGLLVISVWPLMCFLCFFLLFRVAMHETPGCAPFGYEEFHQ